ncbi:MAG: TIGR01212 family radical SAM protein [Bacilli bacterium]
MENIPTYVNSQHRYYTLNYYYRKKFNSKVAKISLNGGFTCPNRDGTISSDGCIFCSDSGSGEFGGDPAKPLIDQFNDVKQIMDKKWPNLLYIVYFQANTNTYKPLKDLKKLYLEAIHLNKNIVAIDIATRPDCLSNETLDYLESLNKVIPVTIELGLQSSSNKTARIINRGYNLDVFEDALRQLRNRNIEVVVHVINGLPCETKTMMLDTVKYLSHQDIQGIKIHSLFVLKGTKLAEYYCKGMINLLSMEEYIDITCEELAYLRKDIVVHRISGDGPADLLIAPHWGQKKLVIMNKIDQLMKKRNYYQGIKYK